MGIVAREAIANCRLVDVSLNLAGVLVGVAGKAKLVGSRSDQRDPGYVLVYANFMAARTACRNRRMDKLALRFFCVTLNAFCGIGVLVEGDRVSSCQSRGSGRKENCQQNRKCLAALQFWN